MFSISNLLLVTQKFAGGCYEKVTWAKCKLLETPDNGKTWRIYHWFRI